MCLLLQLRQLELFAGQAWIHGHAAGSVSEPHIPYLIYVRAVMPCTCSPYYIVMIGRREQFNIYYKFDGPQGRNVCNGRLQPCETDGCVCAQPPLC